LLGKGYSLDQFKKLMEWSHRLLALEIAYVPEKEKKSKQHEYLHKMVEALKPQQARAFQ
jgi:hypothetical protein